MKSKIFALLGAVLLIAGTVIMCVFGKYDAGAITGLSVTFFGAGIAITNVWSKRDKEIKKSLSVIGIALLASGSLLLGLTGVFTEATLTSIIGYAISISLLIAGFFTVRVKDK